jgi:hypothetical protein
MARNKRVYERQELIDKADEIAKQVIKDHNHNRYRDWFFPAMIDRLELRYGVEIGVDKAGFSKNILDRSKIEKWYCVDTWMDDFGSDYKPEYYAKSGDKRFEQAKETIRKDIDAGRAIMMRQTSVEAASMFDNACLDMVYIDGDHSLEGIYCDLKAWIHKVKIGGIIAGHDYKDGPKSGIADFWGDQLEYRIQTVTNDFCARYGYALKTVGGRIISWWFIKNRECGDAVKAYLISPPPDVKVGVPADAIVTESNIGQV